MSDPTAFRWERGLLGAAGVGVLSFAFFFVSGLFPRYIMAIALILLVAGLAWWTYRKGHREVAVGLLAGYAILALISGGQCTMLVEGRFEDTPNVLTGFYGYPLLLVAYLILALIVSAIGRTRRRKENQK